MKFACIKGVKLHYRIDGPPAAPPLVLVNSLGTDARIWDDFIAMLAGRYRVLSYDKRGARAVRCRERPAALATLVTYLMKEAGYV